MSNADERYPVRCNDGGSDESYFDVRSCHGVYFAHVCEREELTTIDLIYSHSKRR
jgi:hypothetical protein